MPCAAFVVSFLEELISTVTEYISQEKYKLTCCAILF